RLQPPAEGGAGLGPDSGAVRALDLATRDPGGRAAPRARRPEGARSAVRPQGGPRRRRRRPPERAHIQVGPRRWLRRGPAPSPEGADPARQSREAPDQAVNDEPIRGERGLVRTLLRTERRTLGEVLVPGGRRVAVFDRGHG